MQGRRFRRDGNVHMNVEPVSRDPLTGALTRGGMHERTQEQVDRYRRYGERAALLVIDLDHFKSINDAFGHARGDQVLVELVGRLQRSIRASDLLFRNGGDEFMLLLPQTSPDRAGGLAQRLLDEIRQRM